MARYDGMTTEARSSDHSWWRWTAFTLGSRPAALCSGLDGRVIPQPPGTSVPRPKRLSLKEGRLTRATDTNSKPPAAPSVECHWRRRDRTWSYQMAQVRGRDARTRVDDRDSIESHPCSARIQTVPPRGV